MNTLIHRGHKIVMSERPAVTPRFQECDVFSGSNFLIGYVWQALSANRTQADLVEEAKWVVDDYILFKEEQSARRVA